jgi:plastocyanin
MLRVSISLIAVAAFAAVILSAAPAGRGVSAAATQEAYVSMQFNRFVPGDLAVAAGTTVVWVNEDYDSGEWHNVIAEDGSFASETVPPGGAVSVTFFYPGVYVYYCDLHEGMFGRIFVE